MKSFRLYKIGTRARQNKTIDSFRCGGVGVGVGVVSEAFLMYVRVFPRTLLYLGRVLREAVPYDW